MSQERDLFELAYGQHTTLTPEQKQAVQARAVVQEQFNTRHGNPSELVNSTNNVASSGNTGLPQKVLADDAPTRGVDNDIGVSNSRTSPTVFSATMLPLNGALQREQETTSSANSQPDINNDGANQYPVPYQQEVATLRMQNMEQHFVSQLSKVEEQCNNYTEQISNLNERLHAALGENQQLTRELALAKENVLHNEGRVVSGYLIRSIRSINIVL